MVRNPAQNPDLGPVQRSAAGALVGASAVSMVIAGTLGFVPEDKIPVSRLSVYGAAIGAGLGAVLGLTVKPKADRAPAPTPTVSADGNWQGWRDFKVVRKQPESCEITSFYLEPQDGGPLPSFKPGQFLTLQLAIPGQARPVIRTYSLSDYGVGQRYYRLSIKREGPPKGQDVPPGVASNFMHDQVEVGTVIPVKPPAGRFFLDLQGNRPVVLLSNGVGITPMLAMAKALQLQQPQRPAWFLHGARNGEFHAFRESVLAIAAPNLAVHYRYSRPRPEDEGQYSDRGYIDADLVKSLMANHGPADADYFMCGSPAFMDSLRVGLLAWGVPEEQIFFESFSKPKPKAPEAASPSSETVAAAEVVFARSGKQATWTPEEGTLLDFAEAQGLDPAFSCRAGVCLTCMCGVEAGEVSYDEPPAGTPDSGTALICVGKPNSDRIVLDL
ncbi:MAG: 2Fe-2S iron-sulfur cluster-binding protein [Leptolyngbyaceae cyanobacterium]